jgi:hypothetical protein
MLSAVAGAFAGVWWTLSTAISLLTESNAGFVKEAFVFCATLVVCVFIVASVARKNTLLRIRERRRPHKLRVYRRVLEEVTRAALRSGAGNQQDNEPLLERLRPESSRFGRDLVFWSAPKVIRAYKAVWNSTTPLELTACFDDLLLAMRSDVGLAGGLFGPGELVDLLAYDAIPAGNSAEHPKSNPADVHRRRPARKG